MSEYNAIKAATDARIFLRNYIYDEETLPILESLLNRFNIESLTYNENSKMFIIIKMDTGMVAATESDFGMCCGVPILRTFCEFISHPIVVEKINRMDFNIDSEAKQVLQDVRYDAMAAGVLIDITKVSPNNVKSGVFSFILKL